MNNFEILNTEKMGFSAMPDEDIFEMEKTYGAHHYGRLNLVVRKTEGCWLTSIDDSKYLDCLAAYSAANQGHHHPKIVAALVDALRGNYASVISNVVYTDALGIFLKKVADSAAAARAAFRRQRQQGPAEKRRRRIGRNRHQVRPLSTATRPRAFPTASRKSSSSTTISTAA